MEFWLRIFKHFDGNSLRSKMINLKNNKTYLNVLVHKSWSRCPKANYCTSWEIYFKDDIFWDYVIWALPLPPNFDNISTFPSILSKIKLASRNVSNYTHLQTDFHSMVMKMLKYCQNLVEDEVLKPYDLKKCPLYFLNCN